MTTEPYIYKHNPNQLVKTNTQLQLVARCPNCKARVAESTAECPLCGEALTQQTLLRTQTNARVYTRQLAAPSYAAPAQINRIDRADSTRKSHPPLLQSEPSATADRPRNSVPRKAPRPSAYKVGLLMGFTLAILGAALLIAMSLMNQTTTEARSLDTKIATPQVAVTLMAKPLTEAALGNVAKLIAENAEPTAKPAPPQDAWELKLVSSRYEFAGRPKQGCGEFDTKDPVRKFTFTLNITNNTDATLAYKQWGMTALAGNQRAIRLCSFYTTNAAIPDLASRQTQQMTFTAFVERSQQITTILLGDSTKVVGRLCVNDTEAVACN